MAAEAVLPAFLYIRRDDFLSAGVINQSGRGITLGQRMSSEYDAMTFTLMNLSVVPNKIAILY